MCQPCFHHPAKSQHGGIPSNHWNMYRRTLKPTNVCSLCWLSGWLGCLEFQHLHAVFQFGLHLHPKGRDICDRTYCHSQEKKQGQARVQHYSNKVTQTCFFPSLSRFCLSLSSFDAFPWEQRDRAGRCCCPWCRNNLTEQKKKLCWKIFVIWVSPAQALQGNAMLYLNTRVALHMYKVQTHKLSRHLYTHSLVTVSPKWFKSQHVA